VYRFLKEGKIPKGFFNPSGNAAAGYLIEVYFSAAIKVF